MIERIWDFFEKSFGINAVIVMMIALAIFYFVTNLPKIMDSITYFQSRKIKHITEALSSEWVDDNYKKLLKKEISILYLSGTLKVKASEKQVKEIVELSNITEGHFSIVQIYHAVKILIPDFYNLNSVNLKIEKSRIEIINYKIRSLNMILIIFMVSTFLFFEDEIIREIHYTYTGDSYVSLIFMFPVFMSIFLIKGLFSMIKELESSNKVIKYFINKSETD